MPNWFEAVGAEVFGAVVGLLVPALLLWISSRWMTGRYRLDRIASAERDHQWALDEASHLRMECEELLRCIAEDVDADDHRAKALVTAARTVSLRALANATVEHLDDYRSEYLKNRGRVRPVGWTNDQLRLNEKTLARLDLYGSAARISTTMHELRRQHVLRSGRAAEQKSARVAGRVVLASWLLWYLAPLSVDVVELFGADWSRSADTESWPASQTVALTLLIAVTWLSGWLWALTALGPGSRSWRWVGLKSNRLSTPWQVALQSLAWIAGSVAVAFIATLLGALAWIIGLNISH